MIGFGLLVGHLVGDFILQFDWLAKNKSNPFPKTWYRPNTTYPHQGGDGAEYSITTPGTLEDAQEWDKTLHNCRIGHIACFIHCLIYTLCVWAFSFWWMPTWGLAVVFGTHFIIDRFRFARWYMKHFFLEKFATGLLSPHSVIIVDQVFHLIVLFAVGIACAA